MLRLGLSRTACQFAPVLQRGCAARLVIGSAARPQPSAVFRTPVRPSTSGAESISRAPWYERHPVLVAVGVATVKTASADIVIQTQVEQCETIDWHRVGLFTAFGACFFGAWQYFLYVKCFSWWFDAARLSKLSIRQIFAEGGAARSNWLKQMGFDLLLHGHFFFPTYYAFKISIMGGNRGEPTLLEGRPLSGVLGDAWEKYMTNMVDDWIGFWKVWVIGDIVAFGMVPLWARLPTNNAISFLYVLVLSSMRGAPEAALAPEGSGVVPPTRRVTMNPKTGNEEAAQ